MSLTSNDITSASGVHGSLPATVTTLCTAAALAPFAYFQFGLIGPVTVCAFAFAIVLSVWLAAWGAARLSQNYPLLSGLFASSGVRIVAPFAIALVVVLGRGRIVPIQAVYYIVPLYLCMLLVDVLIWVREAQGSGVLPTSTKCDRSLASGEVV